MPKFRGGILDLDGVVVDTEALHLEATQIVFADNDLQLPEGGAAAYIGRTDRDIFAEAIASSDNPTRDIDELLRAKNLAYGAIADRIQSVPGSLQFIRSVAASAVALALATSSIRLNQARAFKALGLDAYFDAIVTADDVKKTKPDPEPYLLAAERLLLDPANCFVVEDSFNGVRSARAAGCHVVGLTSSFPAEQLIEAGAALTISSFDELYAYIDIDRVG